MLVYCANYLHQNCFIAKIKNINNEDLKITILYIVTILSDSYTKTQRYVSFL